MDKVGDLDRLIEKAEGVIHAAESLISQVVECTGETFSSDRSNEWMELKPKQTLCVS
jgi:hypothetical protein